MNLFDAATSRRLKEQGMVIWKTIDNCDGYEISNTGLVRSIDRYRKHNKDLHFYKGKILKPYRGTHGYYMIYFMVNGKKLSYLIHRLVAKNFIKNPDNLPEVNHINGKKLDNYHYNLEWVTHSENIKHAYDSLNRKRSCEKGIIGESENGNIIKFPSLMEAKRSGFDRIGVRNCIKNKRESYKGYRWRTVNV